jgi:hypothetical protein
MGNTGYKNTGNHNTGDCNTGDYSTGDWNTGHRGTGDRNTGDLNTGDWNRGDWNTGYFNIDTPPTVRVFGKEISRDSWEVTVLPNFLFFSLIEWVDESRMSDQDKINNPTFHTTGGYLREKDYKKAFQESWRNASKEDKSRVFNIPNFDADIFLKISGIDVRKEIKKEIIIDGEIVEISQESFEELKRSLTND